MNKEVTAFLDNLKHPFRSEIELLRKIIIDSVPGIEENIKWNGPNYTLNGQDRVTIRVNPAKAFTLILHRGSKVQAQPTERVISDDYGVLIWKSNDRAIADFKKPQDFEKASHQLNQIIREWVAATM